MKRQITININHVQRKNIFLCGRIFVATDIEYDATIYSFPQPRKRCGGIRTLPVLHSIFTSVYKKKRKNMEKMIRYTLLRYS